MDKNSMSFIEKDGSFAKSDINAKNSYILGVIKSTIEWTDTSDKDKLNRIKNALAVLNRYKED